LGNSLIFDNGSDIGIGTTTPAGSGGLKTLAIHGGAGLSLIRFTNDATGQGLFDGLLVGQNFTTGEGIVFNFENQDLVFGTNSIERMRISAAGNVGIGTSAPAAQLHTTGTVRFAGVGGTGNLLGINAAGDVTRVAPAVFNSEGNTITPPTANIFAFAGPTVTVTITSTADVVYFTGNITMGSTTVGGASDLAIIPGYTFNGGVINSLSLGSIGLRCAQNTRQTYGISYAYTNLAPGTYVFGVAANIGNAAEIVKWNNNEYGTVSAIKF
jgi:hypothetical protein